MTLILAIFDAGGENSNCGEGWMLVQICVNNNGQQKHLSSKWQCERKSKPVGPNRHFAPYSLMSLQALAWEHVDQSTHSRRQEVQPLYVIDHYFIVHFSSSLSFHSWQTVNFAACKFETLRQDRFQSVWSCQGCLNEKFMSLMFMLFWLLVWNMFLLCMILLSIL